MLALTAAPLRVVVATVEDGRPEQGHQDPRKQHDSDDADDAKVEITHGSTPGCTTFRWAEGAERRPATRFDRETGAVDQFADGHQDDTEHTNPRSPCVQ